MRVNADLLAHRAGASLPVPVLRRTLATALAGLELALCLHRVAPARRPTDWQRGLSGRPEDLDALVELLLSCRPGAASGWLWLTFDDGYADAAAYVAFRAPRFPSVQFVVFVCPEKVERRAGFRWDLAEEAMKRGEVAAVARSLVDAPVQLADENARPELLALGDHPDYRLASVDELRALATLPNVTLGNHTNVHVPATWLDDATFDAELDASTATFRRLFGEPGAFAFPYGTPRHHVQPRHVDRARARGGQSIWSTEPRPFFTAERAAGRALPRFAVDAGRSPRELGGWIAARSLDFRLRGRRAL